MTTKKWMWILGLLAAVCCILLVFQFSHGGSNTVTITQDGKTLYTIDLSKVTEPYDLTISYGEHYNTISVSENCIYVLEADCDNQVCVNHGPLQRSGAPITCLPHHLVIRWVKSEVDP